MNNSEILIPLKEVIEITSLSGSSIWRQIQKDEFPSSYKIGPRRVAWSRAEILLWVSSKMEAAEGKKMRQEKESK
jgi:predicted DNA-binding transcriptional regulator AlpA|tara:strand:- start:387 stop:611 length:225 start_codon:yes stop_codon:yes gene_type:complete